MNDQYDITIQLRQPMPPVRLNEESEEEFNERLETFESIKDRRFWRFVISTGKDTAITHRQHFAVESPLFVQDGDYWKYAVISGLNSCGIGIAQKPESPKPI